MKIVGARGLVGLSRRGNRFFGSIDRYWRDQYTGLGGLWALEWAWHISVTNLRCVQGYGI